MRVLLYHQKYILSMLWNAAQDYSNRKRIQRKNESQEKTDYCIMMIVLAKNDETFLCPSYTLSIIFAASSIVNAFSVSVRTLPQLPAAKIVDIIVSSLGASTIITISYLPRV